MRKLSFLILSLLLVSCAHDRAFIEDVTILDVLEGEGTVFQIDDHETLHFEETPSERKPLIDLQGHICVSPEQYQILKHLYLDHQKSNESYQSRPERRY